MVNMTCCYQWFLLIKKGKMRLLSFLAVIFCSLTSFQQSAQAAPLSGNSLIGDKKVLIVYYSRTENTDDVAKHIQAQIGGELVRLQTVDPYPAQYRATTVQAKKELESDYRPPLLTQIDNIEQYDIVFIGSPN